MKDYQYKPGERISNIYGVIGTIYEALRPNEYAVDIDTSVYPDCAHCEKWELRDGVFEPIERLVNYPYGKGQESPF